MKKIAYPKMDKSLEKIHERLENKITRQILSLQLIWSYKKQLLDAGDDLDVQEWFEIVPGLEKLMPDDDLWIDNMRDDFVGNLKKSKTLRQYVNKNLY